MLYLEQTMNYKFSLTILLALTIGACQTSKGYEELMNTWIGANVNKLMEVWGDPTGTFEEPNGNTIYAYTVSSNENTQVRFSQSYDNPDYPTTSTQIRGGQSNIFVCSTYFEVNEEKEIVNVEWKGNRCISR
jgi:hypothetical protein